MGKSYNMIIKKVRNYFADKTAFFSILRKMIELNFLKQKAIICKAIIGESRLKVLDIGCGTGEFSDIFVNHEYTGIDISPNYITYAAKHEKGNFQVMDAKHIQFPDASFDFILIMAMLHHLDDNAARQVLWEALRLLKSDGKILVLEAAKIPELGNAIVRFIQNYDKGDFIREPQDYRKIVPESLVIQETKQFRNGGCVYYSMLLKKRYGESH
jgi:ubiquinone/menaquinone biosynthesis C-methylase UbiE